MMMVDKYHIVLQSLAFLILFYIMLAVMVAALYSCYYVQKDCIYSPWPFMFSIESVLVDFFRHTALHACFLLDAVGLIFTLGST